MAYLFKHNFFFNGWTNKRKNAWTDGRTDGQTVQFYYAPNIILGHKKGTIMYDQRFSGRKLANPNSPILNRRNLTNQN